MPPVLLLAALALAAPTPGRDASVVVGLGSSWAVGGTGGAYAPALAQRVALLGHVSRATGIGVELRHARPEVGDAGALFAGGTTPAPAGSVVGYRDELFVGLAIGVAFDVHGGFPARRPWGEVLPCLGFSLGGLFTDTHLDLPGFDGVAAYRGRSLDPMVGFGTGVEVRFRDWVALTPRFDAAVTAAPDAHELVAGERWDAEWRLVPSLELAIRY